MIRKDSFWEQHFSLHRLNRIPILYIHHDGEQLNKKAISKKGKWRAKKKNRSSVQLKQNNNNKENISEMRSGQQRVMRIYPLMPQIPAKEIKAVKIYTPLNMFLQLQMDTKDICALLQPYRLKPMDLQKNGFPLYSTDEPGKVIDHRPKFKDEMEDPTKRWCCRCGEKFHVLDNGVYQAETSCSYHCGKRIGAGPFSCCGAFTSTGCLHNKYHVSNNTVLKTVQYRKTRIKPHLAEKSSVFALDCEMCYTVQGFEVTRVSMVGVDGLTIYDSYVLPESAITDYNTCYSGVTASHLRDVNTTLADVQAVLLRHLNAQTVLIGHGLNNDLRALRIVHEAVVDTSVVFPHSSGFPYKRSLKSIAASVLKEKIQDGTLGHDSVQDARTCMELMLWKISSDQSVCKTNGQLASPPQRQAQAVTTWAPLAVHCPIVGFYVPPVGPPSVLC